MKSVKRSLATIGMTTCLLAGSAGLAFADTTQTTNWEWSHNSQTGTWSEIEDYGAFQTSGYYADEAEWNNREQGTFTWNYMDNLITSGDQVYAYAWLDSQSATDPYAVYTVDSTDSSTELNQQVAPAGWNYLFAYYVYNPGSDYVTLNSNGNWSAVADAIQVNVPG